MLQPLQFASIDNEFPFSGGKDGGEVIRTTLKEPVTLMRVLQMRAQLPQKTEDMMDKEHIKGEAKKAEGKAKEKFGQATGDSETEAEGKLDQAEGEARKTAGDAKDAVRENT